MTNSQSAHAPIIPHHASDNQQNDWFGCYGKPWQGITLESISHPAKFSRALIRCIYKHLLTEGHIKPGDTILDPFAGTALGAVDAISNGLNWIGNELEQKFVDMGQGCDCTGMSKADWVRFYGRWERVNWKDGRHWCPRCLAEARRVLDEQAQLSLFENTKPTTAYVRNSGRIPRTDPHHYAGNLELFAKFSKGGARAVLVQGDSQKLREVLSYAASSRREQPAAGLVYGLISSSPYAQSNQDYADGWRYIDKDKLVHNRHSRNREANYGESGGQLATLPPGDFEGLISSPMFAGNSGGRGEASRQNIDPALFDRHSGGMIGGLEGSEGNIGGLPMRGFEAAVSSAPFANSLARGHVNQADRRDLADEKGVSNTEHLSPIDCKAKNGEYGQAPGNLGTMKDTGFDAAISSPPYAEAQTGGTAIYDQLEETHQRRFTEHSRTGGYRADLQGETSGNLGGLKDSDFDAVISSAPFVGSVGSDDPAKRGGLLASDLKQAGDRNLTGTYGVTEGQLGVMVEGYAGLVSSPAYEDSINQSNGANDTGGRVERMKHAGIDVTNRANIGGPNGVAGVAQVYGQTDGQLGREAGETFWSAARLIVEECYHLLAPGSVSAWVCKDFIKGGQRKPFCDQWRRLCEAVGFEYMYTIRAWQVTHKGKQRMLEGGEIEFKTEFKSFFRRLHEAKPGAERVDWEEVIILRKPAA